MNRREWRIERIREVEREWQVVRAALDQLRSRLIGNPSLLQPLDLERGDFNRADERVDGVFVVRMYAEFEAGLRETWTRFFKRRSHPKMADLLAAITAYRDIPEEVLANADNVRRYRNALVHEGGESIESVPVDQVRRVLCHYFSWLPRDWRAM